MRPRKETGFGQGGTDDNKDGVWQDEQVEVTEDEQR